MLWILIASLVVMAVSLLLDLVDLDSVGNRHASLAIRGLALLICFFSLIDTITNK